MPGRCSQEKGTAEARSGERKRWWNGDGEKKERPEEEEEPDDEDEVVVAEVGVVAEEDGGRSCLRRRRVATEGAGGASGDGEEEAGLGIALFLFLFPLGVGRAEESGGCAGVVAVRSCAAVCFLWLGWRGDVVRARGVTWELGNFLTPRHRIRRRTAVHQ
jgi:hypothetical protein